VKEKEENQVETTKAPADPLTNLHWLAGLWQQQQSDGILYEEWRLNNDGSMSGSSGFIKMNDTIVSETISLEIRDGKVMYIPTVKGQNNGDPIPFTLTTATADSFEVENPAHDFPSRITYHKTSSTSLSAQISGMVHGNRKSETFRMIKVQ